jgi:hypothetical protein
MMIMGRFLDPSLLPKIMWKNLDSIGVRDKDFAPVEICPECLNSFFASSSKVRRPTVQQFCSSRAFFFCHSSDRFTCLDEVPLRFIETFHSLFILPVIKNI